MPILLPSSYSTYGDSTLTEGPFRKHVLAQFRSDASLEWIRELRAAMVRDEVKYRDIVAMRPQLRSQRTLWGRVEAGVSQATIIVIDPKPIDEQIRDLTELQRRDIPKEQMDQYINDCCATAIVAGTPFAYLPLEVAQAVPWGAFDPIASLADFTPDAIRGKIGGGLKQAMMFAARAHAAFDLKSTDSAASVQEVFRSPLATVMLAELIATTRNFDAESPITASVLNSMADQIGAQVESHLPLGLSAAKPLVREIDSRAADELQAADVAAGWAREILEVSDLRAVADKFERVWSNGRRVGAEVRI
jgi:hypothetical protein